MSRATVGRAFAHAKLNLSLRVLAREASGFHQIETMFCALDLADDIVVTLEGRGIALDVVQVPDIHSPSQDLGPVEENLAYRAADAFAMEVRPDVGVRIELTKRIPAGAGLGGGSSDAAAVLTTLNDLHGSPLTAQELLGIGATLGSDVPFFMTGAHLALAWGRGDRLLPLPHLPPAAVVLAVPPERISTAQAYASLADARAPAPTVLNPPQSWDDAARSARNDFEATAFVRRPRLGELRQMLEDGGASIARMTGSGSVIFGVFADVGGDRAAHTAAQRIEAAYADVVTIVTRTRAAGLNGSMRAP